MHNEMKNPLRTIQKEIRLLKILARVPFYPWSCYLLGKEHLRIDEPLKAARKFMKAGEIMANKFYKNLTEAAYEEAKEIYQNLEKENPVLLGRRDYANLGRIGAFTDPFPSDSVYPCPSHKCKESFFGGKLDVPWR